jgi:hypothetical protein
VEKILIDRRELVLEHGVEALDDLGLGPHALLLFSRHPRRRTGRSERLLARSPRRNYASVGILATGSLDEPFE